MTLFDGLSLRARFLLLVVLGVVLPLGISGIWLVRSSRGSGVELVRSRLATGLEETVLAFGQRWSRNQSVLFDLVESDAVQAALIGETGEATADDAVARQELDERWLDVSSFAWLIDIEDSEGRSVARLPDDLGIPRSAGGPPPGFLDYEMVARRRFSGEALGVLKVRLRADALVSASAATSGLAASMLSILDRRSGTALTPIPVDPVLFEQDRFRWGDEEWLAVSRDMIDPPLRFTLAAPLEPVTAPLDEAAARGTLVLIVIVAATFSIATVLAHRLTRSLDGLSSAATAVANGNLESRAEESGPPAVRETARAFNTMSRALRRTLDRLSQQEALAAVGEFAASLAHEVRNPLTSIRIDLERCERKLDTDPQGARALAERALGEIVRLNGSVDGFLRVARSGRVSLARIDAWVPLEAASRAAAPRFQEREVELDFEAPGRPLMVSADSGALEQLVLNLLLNAADALSSGGRVELRLDASPGAATVSVRDDGPGIPPPELERIFDPFYTTKSGGTGLGLAIARRIARAHGGELAVRSTRGEGAVFSFSLSRSDAPDVSNRDEAVGGEARSATAARG